MDKNFNIIYFILFFLLLSIFFNFSIIENFNKNNSVVKYNINNLDKYWENGIENGVWRQYHENNKVKIEMRIENGKRNSVYYKYYQSGRFEIKGKYKDDSMHGTWEYYNKSGKLLKKIEYIDGVAENQKELDAEQDEYLRKLEENGKRLVDPANFINNPEEYMRRSGM